ncbi:hypothetical protein [Paraburkholderia solisilvae]|uniref:Uncharacterized protein n=1 Tax=Paraburkholderia solisilvae TaxID=624376 RepID=A0A6J5EAR8_9BURK|nr:hypothetical protein [Paraburkholderia solisilvae]CAB3762165.1 hypothetical protein LMG29739_03808 [Paraburkholderia solisilvae]
MNSKHVQTFLMVSAAFFAISAPVRSNSAQPASNGAPSGVVRATQAVSKTSGEQQSGASVRMPSGK